MQRPELEREVAKYRRGRVPRALRQRQILALAHDLFVEVGYERATMAELARRAGVSKPVIYNLFASKEELFRDVMAAVNAELTACVVAAVSGATAASARLHAGVLAFLRFVEKRRAAWAALLSTDGGPAGAELANLRRVQARLVAHLIADSIAPDRAAPQPLTTEVLAHAINGAVEFAALWWHQHPDVAAEALADLLTRALSPDLFDLAAIDLRSAAR